MKVYVVFKGRLIDGRIFQQHVPFVMNEMENLTRVQLFVEGFDHPVCDMSLSLHEGCWLYFPPSPPELDGDNDE